MRPLGRVLKRHLKLRIFFRGEKLFVGDVPYYDGSMESAVLSGDTITYYHHLPNIIDSRMCDRVIYAKESYQEAQKAFENKPPTLLEKLTWRIKNYISDFSGFMGYVFIMLFFGLIVLTRTSGWLLIIPIIGDFIIFWRYRPSRQN